MIAGGERELEGWEDGWIHDSRKKTAADDASHRTAEHQELVELCVEFAECCYDPKRAFSQCAWEKLSQNENPPVVVRLPPPVVGPTRGDERVLSFACR